MLHELSCEPHRRFEVNGAMFVSKIAKKKRIIVTMKKNVAILLVRFFALARPLRSRILPRPSPDGIRKAAVDHGSTGRPVNPRDACGGGIIDTFGGVGSDKLDIDVAEWHPQAKTGGHSYLLGFFFSSSFFVSCTCRRNSVSWAHLAWLGYFRRLPTFTGTFGASQGKDRMSPLIARGRQLWRNRQRRPLPHGIHNPTF